MFLHHEIKNQDAKIHWTRLKRTVSKEKAYQATVAIGELVAEDMLEFANKSPREIDRIYVKFRDGMPMATGMKKKLPHVDIRYLVSRLKQPNVKDQALYFWDEYDGYSDKTLWFADPINATGGTTIESLKFVRKHFSFNTTLISHVVANVEGIKRIQTTIDDFKSTGFMNYANLSKKLNPITGYLDDGIDLIPDFGDKVLGTLGDDYSVYDIQNDLDALMGTQAGDVELVKGTILYLIQLAGSLDYRSLRNASWTTENWIVSAIRWYCAVGELPFRNLHSDAVFTLIDELKNRDFLEVEWRPWRRIFVGVYSMTDDGVEYASKVYLPIIHEKGITQKVKKHFDFLIRARSSEIEENIKDMDNHDPR